jgi:hypothetical protein
MTSDVAALLDDLDHRGRRTRTHINQGEAMKIKQGQEADYAKYVEMNSKDGYSKGVVDYAEAWADLMEKAIGAQTISNAIEHTIRSVAKDTSHEADTDGITGYMYGAAVSALSRFWEHGDVLRAWHNRQYVSEEKATEADKTGGVVNPAIVTIGG